MLCCILSILDRRDKKHFTKYTFFMLTHKQAHTSSQMLSIIYCLNLIGTRLTTCMLLVLLLDIVIVDGAARTSPLLKFHLKSPIQSHPNQSRIANHTAQRQEPMALDET
jgi:hypothetical protein